MDSTRKRTSGWGIAAFGAVGFCVSMYLAVIKLANATAACGGIGDCESVNNSSYSEVAGIPIALLGAGAYLVILAAWFAARVRPALEYNASLVLFGVSLAGTLYSAYLTYVEIFVLDAVCPYCVVSAICITGIFIASVMRLRTLAAPA